MFRSSHLFFTFISLATALMIFSMAQAQVPGCTDPLASNYNDEATENDGSCLYPTTTYQPNRIGELPPAVRETSGLILIDTCLWTHNDSGFGPELHCLDTADGHIKRSVWIDGATSRDWEDITMDEAYIYIGDFGNNNGNRRDLAIFKIRQSDLMHDTIQSEGIYFDYPDQTVFDTRPQDNDFDMEAMIALGDSLYLFSKNWVDLQTRVYALPKIPGDYTANLIDSFEVNGLITGADYNAEEGIIVLIGYTPILTPFIWMLWDFEHKNFFAGHKRRIELSILFHQTEAVVWNPHEQHWFLSNEAFSQIVNVPPRLHRLYTDQWLFSPTTFSSAVEKINVSVNTFPNPCKDSCFLDFNLMNSQVGHLRIFDINGGIVLKSKINLATEPYKLDTSDISAGVYFIFVEIGDTIYTARVVKI